MDSKGVGERDNVPSLIQTIPTLLRSVLQVAYDLRWVSDFLFTDLDQSPFHKNLPLPPHAFSATFSTDVHQHMNIFPSFVNDSPEKLSHGCPDMDEDDNPLPPELVGEPDTTKTDDMLLHTTFTPVASHAFVTVGYAFVTHPQDLPNCLPFNPLMPPLIARFVLDEHDDTLIYVNRGGTPFSIGIRAMRRAVLPNCREHFSFVVPDAPYVWPQLPKSAIWMLSSIETDAATFVPPAPNRRSLSMIVLPGLHDIVKDASPWPITDDGALSDGLTLSFAFSNPSHTPTITNPSTAAAMFTPEVRRAALNALATIHSGTFRAAGIRMDALNAITGRFQSCVTGTVSSVHVTTTPLVADGLRLRFVQTYLVESSAVSYDAPLLLPSIPVQDHTPSVFPDDLATDGFGTDRSILEFISEIVGDTTASPTNEDSSYASMGPSSDTLKGPVPLSQAVTTSIPPMIEGKLLDVSIGKSTQAVSIAPRPTTNFLITHNLEESKHRSTPEVVIRELPADEAECTKTLPTKVRRREDIVADRKRRNRLSAARSNERKRLWVEQLERDVNAGRDRITQLSRRQAEMVNENRRLRASLGSNSLLVQEE